MLRLTVYNGLDALHVRLPGTIGTSVRMAHFNAERNVLVAKLTFCHAEAPPCLCLASNDRSHFEDSLYIIADPFSKCKRKFIRFAINFHGKHGKSLPNRRGMVNMIV